MMLGRLPISAIAFSLVTASSLPTTSVNTRGRYFSIHGCSNSVGAEPGAGSEDGPAAERPVAPPEASLWGRGRDLISLAPSLQNRWFRKGEGGVATHGSNACGLTLFAALLAAQGEPEEWYDKRARR